MTTALRVIWFNVAAVSLFLAFALAWAWFCQGLGLLVSYIA